jgi:hypothetical protein
MDRRIVGLVGLIGLLVILRVSYGVFTAATGQPQPDLSHGLIGYWSFDGPDMDGSIAQDRSGQRHNGTLTNGLRTTAGKIGQALEFHEGTDRVDAGSDLISTQAITISAWVYARSNGGLGNGRIVDNGSTVLKIPNTDRLAFSSDGMVTEVNSESGSFNLHTWTHVTVIRTSTGVTNFYLNGVLSGTANQNSGTPVAGVGNVSIGNGTPNARIDVGWDGLIDDLRIYNRVLTADEINRLYHLGR